MLIDRKSLWERRCLSFWYQTRWHWWMNIKFKLVGKFHYFYSVYFTTLCLLLLFFSTTRTEFYVLDHHWLRLLDFFFFSFTHQRMSSGGKKKCHQYVNAKVRRAYVFKMRQAAAGCVSKLSKSDFLWPAGLLKHILFWRTQESNWYQLRRYILSRRPN